MKRIMEILNRFGVAKATGKGKPSKRREWMRTAALCLIVALSIQMNALAASEITSGIGNLQNLMVAFISAVGSLIVLWGIFEWGNAMQSQDGMMQSQAFKRIGGGLIMTLAPQLLNAVLTTPK